MNVTILRWKPDEKNTRKGYADFRLDDIGLTIKECAVHKFGADRGGKVWIAFPARQYEDQTGKTKFFNFLQFDKDANEIFQTAAKRALKAHIGGGNTMPSQKTKRAYGEAQAPLGLKQPTEIDPGLNDEIPF